MLVIIKEGIVNNIKNRSLQGEMKVMTKSNNDFEDITRLRMDFCREFGVTINDEEYFIDKVQTYGYREIIYQYLDHFIENDSEKVRPWTPLTPAQKVIPWTPLVPAEKVKTSTDSTTTPESGVLSLMMVNALRLCMQ